MRRGERKAIPSDVGIEEIDMLLRDSKTALEEALKDTKYLIENWRKRDLGLHTLSTIERESLSNIKLAYDNMRRAVRMMPRSYLYGARR